MSCSSSAATLGVNYLTRERNEHAKAGNLNNGLAHSTGELVAVFDADHAPARDFLRRRSAISSEDPKLFLVQTPHFFSIPIRSSAICAPSRRCRPRTRCSTASSSAASTSGTPPSSAARRRCSAARRSTTPSGFSGVSITEDCETALELHSRGWNSVYVDKPLIAGLQPATFASFIGQRTRWAQGMMQILRFRFPLLKRGLTLPQRLCYMSSHAVLAVPVSARHLPGRAALLSVFRSRRSSPHRAASSSPTR